MSDDNLILKATIEVYVKVCESDTGWFRSQDGPTQAHALAYVTNDLREHVEEKFDGGKDEAIVKIDMTEVPVWPGEL